MRFKIHPLFIALTVVLVICGQALAFIWTFLALLMHELGHAVAARARGYAVKEMVLLPFGALMSVDEAFDKNSSVIIGLAGPSVNLLLALTVLGVWWLFPACYPYTQYFFYANLSLALFNLLPAYPLDGSRVVLGFCKNKLKALKMLQIAGIIFSFTFFILFIVSAFFSINFSAGIIGIFLFYGATSGSKEELYVSVLDGSSKNYTVGVVKKEVKISASTPISRLYHHISSLNETVFDVVDRNGVTLFKLTEADLKSAAVKNRLSTPIAAAYGKNKDSTRSGKELPVKRLIVRKSSTVKKRKAGNAIFKRRH